MDHWADYVIFIGVLAVSVVIGLYHAFTGGKQKTNEEFIMDNRNLKVLPTAVSIIVSYMSALTIVGGPAEMYSYGFMVWPGFITASIINIFLVNYMVIPWIYPLKLTSIYSYFHLRYGSRALQLFSATLGVVSQIVYCGIAVYTPSLSLETVTGFPLRWSIPIMTVVCTIYTTLGGIRAVIWTDVFQSLVMLAGMMAVFIKSIQSVGSFGKVIELATANGRLHFESSADPTVRNSFLAFLLGFPVGKLATTGFSQSSVQRYAALPRIGDARKMQVLWFFGTSTVASLAYMTGIAVLAFYAMVECDPIANGQISSANQVLPLFMVNAFRGVKGFSGLFLATMYSATLSTVSSALSGCAANTWTDMIEPLYPNIPPHRAALVSKVLVFLFGMASMVFAFSMTLVTGSLLALVIGFFSAFTGPLLAMFMLSGFRIFRRLSSKAVLLGSMIGFVLNVWLVMAATITKSSHQPLPPVSTEGCYLLDGNHGNVTSFSTSSVHHVTLSATTEVMTDHYTKTKSGVEMFYSLSYLYYSMFGFLTTMTAANLVHLVLSGVFGQSEETRKVDDRLFISISCCNRQKNEANKQDLDNSDYKAPVTFIQMSETNKAYIDDN